MNVKKYPSTDPHFIEKIRGACRNDYERGMVYILSGTGMHVANLVGRHRGRKLKAPILTKDGDVVWNRVKTGLEMTARIPKEDREVVEAWLAKYVHKRSERAIQYKIREIGERVDIEALSPMSFRVHRACMLLDQGLPIHEVKYLMGCSAEVLMSNYAKLNQARRVERGGR